MSARRFGWRGGLLLCCLLGVAGPRSAPAQHAAPAEDDSRLNTRIKLLLGATTLEKVLAALSEQTGLRVEAADYLKDRRLTVALEGVTAREALDALAELNDWAWRKTGPGGYQVARPTLRLPRTGAEMARAMQAALPKEWRIYLDLERSAADPPPRSEMILPKTYGLRQKALAGLFDSLKRDLAARGEAAYGKLTLSQQEALVTILVCGLFRPEEMSLWRDARGFHRLEVANAFLELQQGQILMVRGHSAEGSYPGFGVNIKQE